MPSLGGSGSYGGDDPSGGASRGNGGYGMGGGSSGDNGNKSTVGGGSFSSGSQSRGDAKAQVADAAASGRRSFADMSRRDRAAVAALGASGRNVNVASDVFNDDEEGINSITEALGRLGSWAADRVGAGAPGGFAKSTAANVLATTAGLAIGGIAGAGVAGALHSEYATAPGQRNTIGNLARGLSGFPGIGGIASLVGAADSLVDLDKAVAGLPTSSTSATAAAGLSSGMTGGLYQGRGGDNASPAAVASASGGNQTQAVAPAPAPITKRRTLSKLNVFRPSLRPIDEFL